MSIRTNYEKWYEGDDYYWGTDPSSFLDELIQLCPPSAEKNVLDIGCGEGKDAVYMAKKRILIIICAVIAFYLIKSVFTTNFVTLLG